MQKNIWDRKNRRFIPGLVWTQTSWAVRLLVASITEPAQLETLMMVIIPATGSSICMCICETENRPSSESDCSCGHQARACSDSQHPAGALNSTAAWRSMAHHVQTKLVHHFLQVERRIPGKLRPSLDARSVTAGSRAMYVSSHSRRAPRLHVGQDSFPPVKDLQMLVVAGDIISVSCLISKALSHNWNLHLHSSC